MSDLSSDQQDITASEYMRRSPGNLIIKSIKSLGGDRAAWSFETASSNATGSQPTANKPGHILINLPQSA